MVMTDYNSSYPSLPHILIVDYRYSDVTFNVQGVALKAHRAILDVRSGVFEKMFNSGMSESKGEVIIDDISPAVFKQLLRYHAIVI